MLSSVPEDGVALGASSTLGRLVERDDTTISLGFNGAKKYTIEVYNNPAANGNAANGHSNGHSNGGGSILDRPYGYVVKKSSSV